VTFAVRSLARYGTRDLLLTTPGINSKCARASLVIKDHLNFMGENPLRAIGRGSAHFVDLTTLYDPGLRRLLKKRQTPV
jgi:purine nucleoside phosphorylase